jgi:hypothetical protein
VRFLVVLLALAAVVTPAAAQDVPVNPALTDRFTFAVGAFYPKTTTEVRIDSTRLGVGAGIQLEDSLGMESRKAVPNLGVRWRFAERFRVEMEYFALNRSGERVIDRDLQIGDQVFAANSNVTSSFDFFDLRVSAGYSFFKRTDKEVGVGLGLHMAGYDISFTSNATGTSQEDVLAPLPVVSLYGQFALTDRWAVGGRIDRFSLSYENFDGKLTSLGLDVTYQPFRHVGFGLAYRTLFISLEAEKNSRTLKFEQSFDGPLLFMTASF